MEARCYTDVSQFTSDLRDCESSLYGSNHGTIVAEAVIDIAPEASLYVATPWSHGDTHDAVDWMASEGVSVIVYPLTSPFDGPGDGTSPFGDSPAEGGGPRGGRRHSLAQRRRQLCEDVTGPALTPHM